MVTLVGPRVVLRPVRMSDAELIYEQFHHPVVSEFIPKVPKPYRRIHAIKFTKNALKHIKQRKAFIWAIVPKPHGKLTGVIEIRPDRQLKRTDIGMWVAKEWQKKGIAREAIFLVMKFCFERLRLHKILATRFAHNEASRGLIESTGFTLEGIEREWGYHRGKFHDLVLYGMIDREWPAVKRRLENRLGIAR